MFLPDKGGQCLIAVRLDKNFVKDIPTRPQTGKNRHAFKRGGRPTPTSWHVKYLKNSTIFQKLSV